MSRFTAPALLFKLDVTLEGGRRVALPVFEGDDGALVAREFVEQYGLPPAAVVELERLVRSNLRAHKPPRPLPTPQEYEGHEPYPEEYDERDTPAADAGTECVDLSGQGLDARGANYQLEPLRGTIDLSLNRNRLQELPSRVPLSLIRLDISHNMLEHLPDMSCLASLRHLDVNNNHLASTLGVSANVALVSINFARNRLTRVEGLEPLHNLRMLDVSDNHIDTLPALRPLSLNQSLAQLSLMGNPVAASPKYRTLLLNVCPQVVYLDGFQQAKSPVRAKAFAAAAHEPPQPVPPPLPPPPPSRHTAPPRTPRSVSAARSRLSPYPPSPSHSPMDASTCSVTSSEALWRHERAKEAWKARREELRRQAENRRRQREDTARPGRDERFRWENTLRGGSTTPRRSSGRQTPARRSRTPGHQRVEEVPRTPMSRPRTPVSRPRTPAARLAGGDAARTPHGRQVDTRWEAEEGVGGLGEEPQWDPRGAWEDPQDLPQFFGRSRTPPPAARRRRASATPRARTPMRRGAPAFRATHTPRPRAWQQRPVTPTATPRATQDELFRRSHAAVAKSFAAAATARRAADGARTAARHTPRHSSSGFGVGYTPKPIRTSAPVADSQWQAAQAALAMYRSAPDADIHDGAVIVNRARAAAQTARDAAAVAQRALATAPVVPTVPEQPRVSPPPQPYPLPHPPPTAMDLLSPHHSSPAGVHGWQGAAGPMEMPPSEAAEVLDANPRQVVAVPAPPAAPPSKTWSGGFDFTSDIQRTLQAMIDSKKAALGR